jgi:hypothetical protein
MLAAALLLVSVVSAAAASPLPADEGTIRFNRLWVSADGKTHLKSCTVQNLTRTPLPGGKTAQYVRSVGKAVPPSNLIFTQQTGDNPWHQCPTTQIVVTLAGRWFVNTTDGDSVVMGPGDVLYQDDFKGREVDGPCNQLVISAPEKDQSAGVGDPGCDWTADASSASLMISAATTLPIAIKTV